MRRWFIWSFERGSFQYDVLCGLIVIAIFLGPSRIFNDRPDYMRRAEPGTIRSLLDDDGNLVYTVQLERSDWIVGDEHEMEARGRLIESLETEEPIEVYRTERIYDSWSRVAAYAFWLRSAL